MEWTKVWLISFNSEKCKILHLGSNNPRYKYTIEGNNILDELAVTDCEKDIGVYVDSNLTFDKHITTTVNNRGGIYFFLSGNLAKSPKIFCEFLAYFQIVNWR